MASAESTQQRRAPKRFQKSSGSGNKGEGKSDQTLNTATESSNQGYDEAVHAGEPDEEQPDVFERLARVDADVDTGIADNLDPEDLVAELEGMNPGDPGYTREDSDLSAPDDFDEIAVGERELDGVGGPDHDSIVLSRERAEGDEDGSVSPEELGEQFLRGAVQQGFHTNQNDRESNDDVDLLADPAHQVSLFDHNLDPLAEPRFPEIAADETRADAEHTSGNRAASKRAAIRNAEDRSVPQSDSKRSRR